MKRLYRLLFALHVFVGIGAMAGGLAAILNPNSPMGIHTDVLKNSPFNNFLIPGIILFTVIGIGNILAALTFTFKLKYQGYISSIFSLALVIWIVVQCIMLNSINFLHIIYFIIGIVEALLSVIMIFENRLFPTSIIESLYNSIIKRV
ncbi:hypothetical protein [Clostridium hydrogeniformans]|uniref:hypothetical protein n=1 Tax=Clostridium hydrogeniformans TaxID=349933 RepID=UPI000484F186|nr:hypothetical protein [Clostridium hydrogeniformans]